MGNSSAHLPQDNETCKEKQIFRCCVSKVVWTTCKDMQMIAVKVIAVMKYDSRMIILPDSIAYMQCGSVRSEYSISSLVCESVWTRAVMLARVCEHSSGDGVVCCILISSSCMCPLLKACLLYRRIRGLLCCDKTLLAQKLTWNGEGASVGEKRKNGPSCISSTGHSLRMVSGTPSGLSPYKNQHAARGGPATYSGVQKSESTIKNACICIFPD